MSAVVDWREAIQADHQCLRFTPLHVKNWVPARRHRNIGKKQTSEWYEKLTSEEGIGKIKWMSVRKPEYPNLIPSTNL